MSVQEQVPYVEYVGNGVTKAFPVTFDCEDQKHLIVMIDGVVPLEGQWQLLDERVEFITPPKSGALLSIKRDTPLERTTTYKTYNNSFRPEPVNNDFDRIWWKLQELGLAEWLTSKRLDKEIQDRIAADIYYYAFTKNETDQKLKDLKDYIDALVNNITGEAILPILDKYIKTWSGRTQENKNKDSIHVLDFKFKYGVEVSDQEAIQDAVNYCLPRNMCLDHEGAHLESTENIQNFWRVSHKGQGSITRNGNKFNITPIFAQINEIHVANGALEGVNDGLSVSEPTTIRKALEFLSKIGTRAQDGFWRIRVTGRVNYAGAAPDYLPTFRNPLELLGEDVPEKSEPKSIIDGVGRTGYAINFKRTPINFRAKNLKIMNWIDSGNGGGFVFDLDSNSTIYNCWYYDVDVGNWSRKGYMLTDSCKFFRVNTFGTYIASNGYGDTRNCEFDGCATGASVARGAIAYVQDNVFRNIRYNAIQINKNARARERGNRYESWANGYTNQCLVLCEEGAIYNDDNNSNNPSIVLLELASDKPHLKLLSGSEFERATPRNGEKLHSSHGFTDPLVISSDNLVDLNTLISGRFLALPAHTFFNDSFKIKIEIVGSVSAETSFSVDLRGAGSSTSLSFGIFELPSKQIGTPFFLTMIYDKASGSDIVNCYASSDQLQYYSSVRRNSTVLRNKLVRDKTESLIIYRPYVQRLSGIGKLHIFSVKIYLEI